MSRVSALVVALFVLSAKVSALPPECGMNCGGGDENNTAPCDAQTPACACGNREWVPHINTCIGSSCTGDDATEWYTWLNNYCQNDLYGPLGKIAQHIPFEKWSSPAPVVGPTVNTTTPIKPAPVEEPTTPVKQPTAPVKSAPVKEKIPTETPVTPPAPTEPHAPKGKPDTPSKPDTPTKPTPVKHTEPITTEPAKKAAPKKAGVSPPAKDDPKAQAPTKGDKPEPPTTKEGTKVTAKGSSKPTEEPVKPAPKKAAPETTKPAHKQPAAHSPTKAPVTPPTKSNSTVKSDPKEHVKTPDTKTEPVKGSEKKPLEKTPTEKTPTKAHPDDASTKAPVTASQKHNTTIVAGTKKPDVVEHAKPADLSPGAAKPDSHTKNNASVPTQPHFAHAVGPTTASTDSVVPASNDPTASTSASNASASTPLLSGTDQSSSTNATPPATSPPTPSTSAANVLAQNLLPVLAALATVAGVFVVA